MKRQVLSLLVLAAAVALSVEGARRDRSASALFSADDDAALLDGSSLLSTGARAASAAGAGARAASRTKDAVSALGGLDVTSLGALREAISDDLSSDSDLSGTLDRLLTGSTVDVDEQQDAVSGEAYGDEAHGADQHSVASAVASSDVSAAEHAAAGTHAADEEVEAAEGSAIENTITEITAADASDAAAAAADAGAHGAAETSAIIPAQQSAPTTVTAPELQQPQPQPQSQPQPRFRQVTDANGPIVPLTGHNSHPAVPVKGPLPGLTTDTDASGSAAEQQQHAKAHRKRHADSDKEESDEEDGEDSAAAAKDKPRFLAERALNRAIAEFSAQAMDSPLTPQQKALASQGGSDPALKAATVSQASTADRIRSAVYVVLAIAGVIALVEAATYLTDYALKNQNVQIDRILSKTYKAMMLLGLVSFLAVCFARLTWMSTVLGDYSPNFLYDLLIVMGVMGLLYLLVMCGLVGYVLYSAAQYRTIELKHPTEGDLTRLENALTKQRDEYNARSCCTRTFASCFAQYNLRQTEFEVQYLQIKQQFVRQHHRRFLAPYTASALASTVPPTPIEAQVQAANAVATSPAIAYQKFEFYMYLRKAMQQGMEEVAAVHWQVWCVVFAVVLVNALRMLAFKSVEAASFVYISVILLWAVLVYSGFLAYSIAGATEELAERYTLYLPERDAAGVNGARDLEAQSDDPDDEQLREAHMVQGGGCCGRACQCCPGCRNVECCSAPNKQQMLFWCQTPSSVTKGVQVAVLLTCLIIPAYIVDMADLVTTTNVAARYAVNILLFLPPVFLLIFLIPMVLPRFLLATSVASMSRLTALRATVVKLNSTAYRAAKLELDKARAAAKGKSLGVSSDGVVASLNTDYDDVDGRSAMSEEDDDDSDLENDHKSQAGDAAGAAGAAHRPSRAPYPEVNPNAASLGGAPLLPAASGAMRSDAPRKPARDHLDL